MKTICKTWIYIQDRNTIWHVITLIQIKSMFCSLRACFPNLIKTLLGLGRTHIVICVVGRALPWNSVVQELTPLDILPLLDVSDRLSSQRARQFWVEWNWDKMLICGSVSCSRFRSSSPSLVQRLSGDNWCLLTISPFWMSHKNFLKRKI